MAQNRNAPAYQEYAASMLARSDFRVLGLAARGLLYTLRLECWVNFRLPREPARLARVLRLPLEEVERALSELCAFFEFLVEELRCPELDDYRCHLDERRQRQAAGGRAGAAKTNSARLAGSVASRSAGKPQVARESLVKPSPTKSSQAKSLEVAPDHEVWVNDYERASRGH